MTKKFYVTTPIYYVTARPHLGSLYSTLLADVATRWHKLKGEKTFFLTGTDEHGQKVAEAAKKVGKEPKEFVDSFIPAYKDTWKDYEIEYSRFIRTTDRDHVEAVQGWIKKLIEKGDIYKGEYKGFYCTPCETFMTEAGACESCGRETSFVSEESWFFRLSKYQDRLLALYRDMPGFITPSERANEVVKFVESGLRDLSISRATVKWGIPFPGDDKHVTYVWADALNNYITGIGYGSNQREFERWWPADMQILGKDIIKFHAVYWPAFLMASDLALPKQLLVHGWIKVNNQKMSKSLGNAVDPKDLLDKYGADVVRYYLTRYMAITQDSEFGVDDLENRNNSDLANNLGNLLNRTVMLALKKNVNFVNKINDWGVAEIELKRNLDAARELFAIEMDAGYFYRALNGLWKFINEVNSYVHAQEPWKVKDEKRFEEIISAVCHSLYGIAMLLWPVMPNKMGKLLGSIGMAVGDLSGLIGNWDKSFKLNKIDNLFEKFMVQEIEKKAEVTPVSDNIDITDFAKVQLKMGTIEQAEEVQGSEKLLKLQVNFGEEKRQVLSGIKKYYKPEDLVGKQALFVYNLAPRKMMGLESHGMMLFAQDENGNLKFITGSEPVINGAKLQ